MESARLSRRFAVAHVAVRACIALDRLKPDPSAAFWPAVEFSLGPRTRGHHRCGAGSRQPGENSGADLCGYNIAFCPSASLSHLHSYSVVYDSAGNPKTVP